MVRPLWIKHVNGCMPDGENVQENTKHSCTSSLCDE
jgi:hypothetical protein